MAEKEYTVVRGFAAVVKDSSPPRKVYFTPENAHMVGELLSQSAIREHVKAGNLSEAEAGSTAKIPLEAAPPADDDDNRKSTRRGR